jgi:Glycosyltransferase (GlcNAc)
MEYVPNSAAIFTDKALGWEIYQELSGPVLPFPTVSDSWSKADSTLFISIASFRDKLCPHTLFNAYTKAKHPKRLSIGVVQQNTETDVDCLIEYCNLMKGAGKYSPENGESCPFETSIKMMRVDSRTAKGPTWGRAKAHQLLGDEEFCMQTDAHMDFVPNWDVKIMKMWADTKNEYAILSTYVADSAQLAHNEKEDSKGLGDFNEVPHLCMVTLDGANGLVRVWGTKCMRNLPHPKLTNAIWGAGLSFSKCHAERKVPYDIHTPFIFDGEEFSRSIRFWTWGYDIYTPHRVYVVHNYKKSQVQTRVVHKSFVSAFTVEEHISCCMTAAR